jgi:hypothetical protein
MKDFEDELNLPAIPDNKDYLPVVLEDTPEEVVDVAKDNIISAREIAKEAVFEMLELAKQSQQPKAYEVLNSLIKTYADVSAAPVEIEIKRKKLTQIDTNAKQEESKVVNQNLFVGTTTELFQMIENMKTKNE